MGPVKRAIVFGGELAGAISRDRSRDFSDFNKISIGSLAEIKSVLILVFCHEVTKFKCKVMHSCGGDSVTLKIEVKIET